MPLSSYRAAYDHVRDIVLERAVPVASHGGFGLGLYIARQIVHAHGGCIEVVDPVEAGATLRVTLPLQVH